MEWKKEKEKLQRMSFLHKVRYIATYYRWAALFLIAAFLLLLYLGDVAYQSTKTFVLQGFIANDEEQLFHEKELTAAFSAYLNLKPKEIAVFDDSLYVQFGKADHYIEASMAKIYAYMAAKELDFLIGPKFVVDHYQSSLAMRDISNLLKGTTEAFRTLVEPYLHKSLSSEGVEGYYTLELGFTRFTGEIPLYMIIPKGSPNPERVVDFLLFAAQ